MSCPADAIRNLLGQTSAAGITIPCYVQPRSSREAVVGVHDGALKIALTAPPVEGQANAALCRFIGKTLHLPKAAVQLASGQSSRRKIILVTGIDIASAADLLAAAAK